MASAGGVPSRGPVAGIEFRMAAIEADSAQNTFEYVLAVGVLAVGVAAALWGFDAMVEQIVAYACPSVDTADGLATVGSCITSIGS